MDKQNTAVELVDIKLSNDAGACLFEGLNLSLAQGETAIIIGPTGVGKTSLVELLCGCRRQDAGTVIIFGQPVKIGNGHTLTAVRRKIGGVGGIFKLISYQTVYENLLAPLIICGERPSVQKTRVNQVLMDFRLQSKKCDKARELSRGQQILVMLARAIIADQPLLIIDEPLAGLDAAMAGEVLELLRRFSVAGHTMVILSTGRTGLEIPNAKVLYIKDGILQ
ncbi:MAG: ATP-binding cassette domain-containing protein [Candidatus Zixiibacteriota bacterium]|nr:MAG: ATP-binding cassette domain-containing protein [candidate division Zixibacteria bacterium]